MRPCTARQKRFSLRRSHRMQVTNDFPWWWLPGPLSSHYGISTLGATREPARLAAFLIHPVENPHKIWGKCFARTSRWYKIRCNWAYLLLTIFKEDFLNGSRHDQNSAGSSSG